MSMMLKMYSLFISWKWTSAILGMAEKGLGEQGWVLPFNFFFQTPFAISYPSIHTLDISSLSQNIHLHLQKSQSFPHSLTQLQ